MEKTSILTRIALGAMLAFSGCDYEEKEKEAVEEAKKVYNLGQPKVLRVYLSTHGYDLGPEKRYFDFDGDGKTVEQYVVAYSNSGGFVRFEGLEKNLIRKGVKPKWGRDREAKVMTPEEEKKIDKEYQELLKINKR